jgi:cell division protein FtsB
MAATFFIILGVISINLAELFRYPAYFAKYKIDIAGFFQGVENFLSLHWLLNTFTMLMMGMYFIKRYIKDTFKIKNNKILKIITLVLALLIAYVSVLLIALWLPKKSKPEKKELVYFADTYLNNALRLLDKGDIEGAKSEIKWALRKSNMKIDDEVMVKVKIRDLLESGDMSCADCPCQDKCGEDYLECNDNENEFDEKYGDIEIEVAKEVKDNANH